MRLSTRGDRQMARETKGGPGLRALPRLLGRLSERLVRAATEIMLAGMTLMVTYDVIMRYAFNRPTRWADEAAMYSMVWMGLLSAAFGVRERAHIRLEFVVSRLPAKWQRWVDAIVELGTAAFGLFVAVYGWRLSQIAWNQRTPALGLRTGVMYLVLPIAGVILMAASLQNLFELRNGRRAPGGARE